MATRPAAITLNVNGKRRRITANPGRSLLSVLRDDLNLTGTKYGCGEGQCGACMVLLDGVASPSCQTTVREAVGKHIVTIEGLSANGRLHPLQQAFMDLGAMQCGYCTPGMIIGGVSLLTRIPDPTPAQIRQEMQKNICRCGAYPRIVRAIRRAAADLRDSGQFAEAGP